MQGDVSAYVVARVAVSGEQRHVTRVGGIPFSVCFSVFTRDLR